MSEQSAEKDTRHCEACPDCLHDGHKCCGCYDGACCRAAHPCGHAEVVRGCGGCDPGAIEFVRDGGGPWVRVLPPEQPAP